MAKCTCSEIQSAHGHHFGCPDKRSDADRTVDDLSMLVRQLVHALSTAEAALADIGDADREPGDDLAWCERRAAQALPHVRVALAAQNRVNRPRAEGVK